MSRFGTAVGVFGEGPPPLLNWSKDKEHYILLDERESAARGSLWFPRGFYGWLCFAGVHLSYTSRYPLASTEFEEAFGKNLHWDCSIFTAIRHSLQPWNMCV